MKKILSAFLFTCLSVSVFAQGYHSVFVEKKDVDQNNWIFAQGREFAYEVDIEKDGQRLYLAENGLKSMITNLDNSDRVAIDFKLSSDPDSAKIKDVFIKVVNPKESKRTNKNQTEILYFYEIPPKILSNTGVVENDQNVWMHPPRTGFFRSLETCPFPYYHFDKIPGDTWKDEMTINSTWSDPLWGEWEGELLQNYTYTLEDDETLETPMGELKCKVISSVADSELGTSKLLAHFSGEYGFVKLQYELWNGIKVTLHMVGEKKGKVISSAAELFQN
jgi:hypothetical protein